VPIRRIKGIMAYSAKTQEILESLRPMQQAFVVAYADRSSETFGNGIKSHLAAGYKKQKSDKAQSARVCQLLENTRVKAAINAIFKETTEKQGEKQAITLQWLDAQLQQSYQDFLEQGDNTNRTAVLRLLGQRLSAYSDKIQNEHTFKGYEPTDSSLARDKQRKYIESKGLSLPESNTDMADMIGSSIVSQSIDAQAIDIDSHIDTDR
jgi:hypothetical protein